MASVGIRPEMGLLHQMWAPSEMPDAELIASATLGRVPRPPAI